MEDWLALNSTFARQGGAQARRATLIGRLRGLASDARPMPVTHQVNVSALSGVSPRSGEIVVIRLDAGGARQVLVRIDP